MKIGKKKNKMVSGKLKKRKKMIRKPKAEKEEKTDYSKISIKKPWGGHLPLPPDDCPKKEYIFMSEDIPWIDLGICLNCPDYPKGCARKQNYLREMKLKNQKQK